MQQSEQLARERVAALLEDRRLRMEEERARGQSRRRSCRSRAHGRAVALLLVHQDYLALKHDALQTQRVERETSEALRVDSRQIKEQMAAGPLPPGRGARGQHPPSSRRSSM